MNIFLTPLHRNLFNPVEFFRESSLKRKLGETTRAPFEALWKWRNFLYLKRFPPGSFVAFSSPLMKPIKFSKFSAWIWLISDSHCMNHWVIFPGESLIYFNVTTLKVCRSSRQDLLSLPFPNLISKQYTERCKKTDLIQFREEDSNSVINSKPLVVLSSLPRQTQFGSS